MVCARRVDTAATISVRGACSCVHLAGRAIRLELPVLSCARKCPVLQTKCCAWIVLVAPCGVVPARPRGFRAIQTRDGGSQHGSCGAHLNTRVWQRHLVLVMAGVAATAEQDKFEEEIAKVGVRARVSPCRGLAQRVNGITRRHSNVAYRAPCVCAGTWALDQHLEAVQAAS